MKKIITIIFLVILVIITCLTLSFFLYSNYKLEQEKKEKERYDEIKENVKNAVERNLRAMYPSCSISKYLNETSSIMSHYNSSFLINYGYIKKSELLDIDNEHYCDVYVENNEAFDTSLEEHNNCKVYYKIYLKCENYEEKGYMKWN